MLYRVYFSDGSQELVEAHSIGDAKEAVNGYGSDVARVIALGDSDDDDELDDDLDDEELDQNPEDEEDEDE